MTKNENLDYFLDLLKKRNALLAELGQLQSYIDYLNTPVLSKEQYFYYYPQAKKSGLRTISSVLIIIGILPFFMIIVGRIASNGLSMVLGILSISSTVLFLLIGIFLSRVAQSSEGNVYSGYIARDSQYRYFCNSKVGEYNEKSAQFQRLEHTLRDPSVCVLPVQLWNNAEEIIGYVKSGRASTINEAISRLGFM